MIGAVAVEDAVHLQHPGGLAEEDVSADGIAGAPFMNDNKTERLNISQIGMIQVLVDQAHGLGGKGLGGLRRAAVPPDHTKGGAGIG